jgi:mRNA-degrading endonuclease RelE of RelBE toxin-antitoxin system
MTFIFQDILALSLDGYNVTKMKGYDNLYRLRQGGIRVLFVKGKDMGTITAMGYRKDVYKKI